MTPWNCHYAALTEYGKEHGTCNIPGNEFYQCKLRGLGEGGSVYRYKDNLGSWLLKQKQAKNGIGKYHITDDQIAKLQILVDEGKAS